MSWKDVSKESPKPNSRIIGYDACTQKVDVFFYTTYGEWWTEGVIMFPPERVTHWINLPENEC